MKKVSLTVINGNEECTITCKNDETPIVSMRGIVGSLQTMDTEMLIEAFIKAKEAMKEKDG